MEFLNRATCDWLIEAVELHAAAAGSLAISAFLVTSIDTVPPFGLRCASQPAMRLVVPLFSPCSASGHAVPSPHCTSQLGVWVGGWSTDRHQDYAAQDLELSNVPGVRDWMAAQMSSVILPTIAELYQLPPERLLALDVFIVKYSVDVQPGLELHRDSQSFSFNVGISDDFEGGGTRFETLGQTVKMDGVGNMLMHCGRMLHGGTAVTAGLRYILVGFVQVVEPTLTEDRTKLEVSGDASGPFIDRPLDGVALDDHWEAMCA